MEKIQLIVGVRPFTFPDKKDPSKKVTLHEVYIGEPFNEAYGVGYEVREKKVCSPEVINEAFGDWKNAGLKKCYVYCDSNGRPKKIVPVK
jgi:hypothetical protein